MNGHLCRCGTYLRILKAVKNASLKAEKNKSWIEDIF
jgi:aerobic-type carbon monoxide dehydrogenase small subunit (CoxS/CutS family)